MHGSHIQKAAEAANGGNKDFRVLYFSELLKRPVCAGKIKDRIGKLTDLVFHLSEPYPEAVGIFIDHGWSKGNQFIPWDKVIKIEDDAIFVQPPDGEKYPPFVDQPGWILVEQHLMGKTILDLDGRRTEVVNDVHLLESRGKMILVHVDISFNGFLRKWGLGKLHWMKDQFVSWRYVQPLNVEDALATDAMSLSITRKQIKELPSEDLADALETLSANEQQAVFNALDSEKAAETLIEAEPRAQRQLIANLRQERAKNILSELTVPQLAALMSVLPHDDKMELMGYLPKDEASKISALLSEREATAGVLMTGDFLAMPKEVKVGEAMKAIRESGREYHAIAYVYVTSADRILLGVVDLRELVLSRDDKMLGEIMTSPVVSADDDDTREDLEHLFAKYHYRMIPVVNKQDHLLGVIHYKDIMKGLVTRAKA